MIITDDKTEKLRKLFEFVELTAADLKGLRSVFEKPSKPLQAQSRTGLIIVDPQIDYCLQGREHMGTENTEAIFPEILKLRRLFHQQNLPVFIPYMDHANSGFENAMGGLYKIEIHAGDMPFPKTKQSAFSDTGLKEKCCNFGLDALIITCVNLSDCVKKTALASINARFSTYVAGNCVANGRTSSLPLKPSFDIKELKGTGVEFISSENVPSLISS
ncbi:MAG: isochorismatase family protein [Alphaproteobacteria bacterium]|nr:isochorismatase family protein [Alphaproteobacteria bacterium]